MRNIVYNNVYYYRHSYRIAEFDYYLFVQQHPEGLCYVSAYCRHKYYYYYYAVLTN